VHSKRLTGFAAITYRIIYVWRRRRLQRFMVAWEAHAVFVSISLGRLDNEHLDVRRDGVPAEGQDRAERYRDRTEYPR
jgi:hypothetical protein